MFYIFQMLLEQEETFKQNFSSKEGLEPNCEHTVQSTDNR